MVAKLKTKPKTATQRDPRFMDEKYMGTEPKWDTEKALKMDSDTFDHTMRKSFRYYSYFYTVKDLKKVLVAWLKDSGSMPVTEITLYAKTPDTLTPMTACSLVKAHKAGMPLKDDHKKYILDTVRNILATYVADKEEDESDPKAKAAPKPSIQDRIVEKMNENIGELEGLVDDMILGKPLTKDGVLSFCTANNVPQATVSRIKYVFEKQFAELNMAQVGVDEQLVEGYSHLDKKAVKRYTAFYESMMAQFDAYAQLKKVAKKARMRKAPSKDKLVSKIKYLKEDKGLKMVSINPADIVGASELWCFDTKTRKLFKYVADSASGPLSVKGASVVGYDEIKSVGKTLRKPEEQLKEFMKAGKVALRTFLKDIKAVEIKANGRINANQLLLKVA